jgi:hypothetical protein
MFSETNGVKINCELSGKEQAPVVALSHSLACSMRMWVPPLFAPVYSSSPDYPARSWPDGRDARQGRPR